MMRSGDINAISESAKLWDSGLYGHLSDDPLKTRNTVSSPPLPWPRVFAIEGGMDEEDAYNASDLYIQDLDNCKTPEDVRRLHTDMMTFFTWAMADMQKAETHSKAVNECMDYIHYHLHEKITVAILAQHVHLNPTYLSELFARETGNVIVAIHYRQTYGSRRKHAEIFGIQLQ